MINQKDLILILIAISFSEFTDICPRLARRIVKRAAFRWTESPDRAQLYAEEWVRIIDDRPGKLLKLFTAINFSVGAYCRFIKAGSFKLKSRLGRTVSVTRVSLGNSIVFAPVVMAVMFMINILAQEAEIVKNALTNVAASTISTVVTTVIGIAAVVMTMLTVLAQSLYRRQ